MKPPRMIVDKYGIRPSRGAVLHVDTMQELVALIRRLAEEPDCLHETNVTIEHGGSVTADGPISDVAMELARAAAGMWTQDNQGEQPEAA